jgi:arylsulfatase A-like enzyme
MRHLLPSLPTLLAGLFSLSVFSPSAFSATRPNIVIIMADDMGISDLGSYGSEIPTPHLDALAKQGVRFNQFYNVGRCCPTRAALLTGVYPHQAGVGHMTAPARGPDGKILRGYQGKLADETATIAEVLRDAGYFTAMVGKWHVGQNLGVVPWERGFMRSLNAAAGGFYFPEGDKANLFLNGQPVGTGGKAGVPTEWYSTDLWTDYSLKFIDEARAEKKPFFVYLAENAPHFPLQAPAEDIARFRGKYKAGWDQLRLARHERQIAAGFVDPAWPLAPRPENVPAWDSLSASEQDRYDHLMAIFAATMHRMDQAIGRLVAGLKERGELDNTLILFLSDNGGNAESGIAGRFTGTNPGGPGSSVFVGECWALLENTPFRRYKHYNHEGGIASPLIAHWPAGIPAARAGQWTPEPGHLIDLMATCVDVAGAKFPATRAGHTVQPMEGISLRPAFLGQPLIRTAPLFWEHEGNAAVRAGDWKLVRLGATGPWELYHLKTDRTELRDLASAEPARVAELTQLWNTWAHRTFVLPAPARAGTDNSASPAKKKAGPKNKNLN